MHALAAERAESVVRKLHLMQQWCEENEPGGRCSYDLILALGIELALKNADAAHEALTVLYERAHKGEHSSGTREELQKSCQSLVEYVLQ